MKTKKDRNSILQSVQNGMRILQLFSQEKPVWGVTEIAQTLQIHKSSVSRLVSDLVAEGFLQKEQNKYCLGYSLLYLSGVITAHLEIQREAKELLRNLVNQLGETAHIAILEGMGITYVKKIQGEKPIELLSSIGRKNPVSCTSSGKVLLAYQKEEVIQQVMDAGLPKMGPNSVTIPEQFKKQLKQIRKQGYSVCIDEMHEDVISLAAPIRDYSGEVVAAVSIVGTRQRMNEVKMGECIDAIIQAGYEISLNLGFIPNSSDKEWSVV
nr:IclR family transcriptional regulator [uncultured Bacillus sp.]